MVYGKITDDIIYQEGTFGFSFVASGALNAGQLVKPAGPMQVVYTAAETDNAIGVAAYDVSKGEVVTVYGPGNIVRCYVGLATGVGADMFPSANGCIDDTQTYGGTAPCIGISLEAAAKGSGAIRVLLK